MRQQEMKLNKTKTYQTATFDQFEAFASKVMARNNWTEGVLSTELGFSSNTVSGWRRRKKVPMTALLAVKWLARELFEARNLTGSEAMTCLILVTTHTTDERDLSIKLAKMAKQNG